VWPRGGSRHASRDRDDAVTVGIRDNEDDVGSTHRSRDLLDSTSARSTGVVLELDAELFTGASPELRCTSQPTNDRDAQSLRGRDGTHTSIESILT
jgi:hypothetical protein